jgi:hypothetical protein
MTCCAHCRSHLANVEITLHMGEIRRVSLCPRCCAQELERMLSALSVEGKAAWLRRNAGQAKPPPDD